MGKFRRNQSTKIWNKIRQISGQKIKQNIPLLKKGTNIITSPNDIANELADTFCEYSSNRKYRKEFITFKNQQEKTKIPIEDTNSEINYPITQ